jgi:orotate phosphoribosyltransferase
MSLFNFGKFTLKSGARSNFKIDCDALTDKDIDNFAKYIVRVILDGVPVGHIVSIPTGGNRLALAIEQQIKFYEDGYTLIIDDVCTTGGSFIKTREDLLDKYSKFFGICLFARGKTPTWVFPIFEMKDY